MKHSICLIDALENCIFDAIDLNGVESLRDNLITNNIVCRLNDDDQLKTSLSRVSLRPLDFERVAKSREKIA